MSRQRSVAWALRRRADALEDEGLRVAVSGEEPVRGELSTAAHPRSAAVLFFMAKEFRSLADEIAYLDSR
jgi:hypothetical protein